MSRILINLRNKAVRRKENSMVPFVNWIIDLVIRIEALIKKQSTTNIIGLILVVVVGYIFAFIDLIMVIINKDFLLME